MNMLLRLLPLLLLPALAACATARVEPDLTLAPTGFHAPVSRGPAAGEALGNDDQPQNGLPDYLHVSDPLEGMNRAIYAFNARLDSWVLLPAVDVYRALLPEPARLGVSNVFDNFGELPTLLNCLLQGKLECAGITLSRLLMNTSFGLFGLVDVATPAGLPEQDEDFGQTLGAWGVGSGPYLVLPLFGPSSVRDAVGLGGDWVVTSWEWQQIHAQLGTDNRDPWDWSRTALEAVDTRHRQPFRYHGTDTPFEYDMMRYLSTKKRELDIRR
jgi:phospholipid-binding lipoprotein MlaA